MMEIKSDNNTVSAKKTNGLFWVAIVFLLISGVVVNHYFSGIVLALRLAGWLILACIEIFLISKTTQGRRFWNFAKDARIELRKVVWPTRQETVRTTMVVAALVIVMALIMWGVDSILLWAIGWLAGQR